MRPGTYEITVPRYDNFNYFTGDAGLNDLNNGKSSPNFELSENQWREINKLIKQHDLSFVNADRLMQYAENSIQGREYGKFVFSRLLSDALEKIAETGERAGLDRFMLSNLEIKQFLEQDVTLLPQSGLEALELMANENIKRTSIYNKIRLPLLIMERDHAFIAPFQISVSNFITSKKLSAEVVLFLNKDFNYNFSEKIVLIENADLVLIGCFRRILVA